MKINVFQFQYGSIASSLPHDAIIARDLLLISSDDIKDICENLCSEEYLIDLMP